MTIEVFTQRQEFVGHRTRVVDLEWLGNERRIASCSTDGTIKVWQVGECKPLIEMAHDTSPVHCLAYSVKKEILASGGSDGTTRLWRNDGTPVGVLHGPADVRSVAWSSNGKLCSVETSHIHIWNVESCRRENLLFGHERMIRSVKWVPQQDNIVSAGNDATIILWDAHTGAPVRKLQPNSSAILDLALNGAANLLVLGAEDGTISILELFPLRNIMRLRAHTGRVANVSLCPDGSVAASAGSDGTIRFWSTRSYLNVGIREGPKYKRQPIPIAFHPKRPWFAAPGKDGTSIQVFDIDMQQLLSQSVKEKSVFCGIQERVSEAQHFDVFLCHNSEDTLEVEALARKLQERRISPWLDIWHLRPGFPWLGEIELQIGKIPTAAVCVGGAGLGPWQKEEIAALLQKFVSKKCPVIPVILTSCDTEPELPPFLAGRSLVDFRKMEADPLSTLIWGITGNRE